MKIEKDAFPTIRIESDGDPAYCSPKSVYYSGMSLRDYFAGQALIALVKKHNDNPDLYTPAKTAYKFADEMMKARSIKNSEEGKPV